MSVESKSTRRSNDRDRTRTRWHDDDRLHANEREPPEGGTGGTPSSPSRTLVGKYSRRFESKAQWVLWRYEDRKGRWTKVPRQPDGSPASSIDAETWAPFDFVQTAYVTRGSYDGVGFVLTLGDPYVAFDFDHCVDRETSEITDLKVRDYVAKINSYTEISPSGTGLRLIVRAKLPERDRKAGSFECYEDRRFVSITGHLYRGNADGHYR